ncbi:GGDEF domain-containing protein [Aureimonas endophytica]|uniref:GGDEF domain-containing protein n=1 Tax=Aureimonas endophytica TaxID=2027858 RepID=A0A916ZSM4_9HYPH|nr:GGDEF domain-containing protein [Aureimonas endophytica]GGE10568.1 GGDEF domain-containing protein [Aureimonas endophytica]
MLRRNECDEIYRALVAELAYSIVPTAIMSATLFGVGLYAYLQAGELRLIAVTLVGTLLSLAKIGLILAHQRQSARVLVSTPLARRFEAMHAVITWPMASSVGALAAAMFHAPVESLHIVATALLFGYCAGVVTRLSIRPLISATAVMLAAAPPLATAALSGVGPHMIVASIFLVFLLGSLETIGYVYRTAKDQITLRLEMAALARRDPLTHLLNRLGLREAFDQLKQRPGTVVALHVLDLDGFKAINDTYGHHSGDRLLKEVANRLNGFAEGGAIVARTGGDEFVIVQPGAAPEVAPDPALGPAIHAKLTRPYAFATGEEHRIGLSLGYTVAAIGEAALEDLIRCADHAAYAAKRGGGGVRHAPYPPPAARVVMARA